MESFNFAVYSLGVSTINAILEADADGTVHLPVPAELRHGKIAVRATLEAVGSGNGRPTPDVLEKRKAALQRLRELGGLSGVISDPAQWQRDCRQERPLPERD